MSITRKDNSGVDYHRPSGQNAKMLYETQPEVMVSLSVLNASAGLAAVPIYLTRPYKNILKISLVRVSGDAVGNSVGIRRINLLDEQGMPLFRNWQNAGDTPAQQDGWIQLEANAGYSNSPIAIWRDGQGKLPPNMSIQQSDAAGNALTDTTLNLVMKLTLSEWQ